MRGPGGGRLGRLPSRFEGEWDRKMVEILRLLAERSVGLLEDLNGFCSACCGGCRP